MPILVSQLKTERFSEEGVGQSPSQPKSWQLHPQSQPHQWPNFIALPLIFAETPNRPKLQV